MHPQQYAHRYQEAQISSVDRRRLLLLVLEGGGTFLNRARDGLAQGDLARFGESSSRAQAIISELLGTLDFNAGGEIAKQLGRLYEFMLHHLTEASAQRSVRHVDEVIKVFSIIAGAYREILERPPTNDAAA